MKKPILFLPLFASLHTFAQNRDLYFEHLNVAEDLAESFVKPLHQDRLGYKWIGTHNGLKQYYGYRLKISFLFNH